MQARLFQDAGMRVDTIVPEKVTRKIKAYGDKCMIVEVAFKTGATGASHSHPHEQITYCLSGEFDFRSGGAVFRLKAGDSILVPGDDVHDVLCVSEGRLLDIFAPLREDFLATLRE